MVTYILQCYTKNVDPHDPKTKFFEREELFDASPTAFVQSRLVKRAIADGFFVRSVTIVKGEVA